MTEPNPNSPVLFGKYRLLRKLAQGGMAEIYLAKSTGAGGFEKTVIVKKILPRLSAHEKFVRMFINEAKVTSNLSHSNIVQIFDFGRVGQDYFIAMEWVDGKDLRSIVRACRERKRRVPLEFALYAGVQVTRALDYAHTRYGSDGEPLNIIHRDVSPQNVLLSRQGEVKLTDFGIAKATTSLNETVANEIKGNFGYMPPEQASGQPLDPRCDVYAAAMVLYELLTLKNPFADANLLAVIQKIREMPPPPPSHFNPAVTKSVDRILLKALEKSPDARFANAQELSAELSEELFPSPSELVQASFAAFLNSMFPPDISPSKAGATPPGGMVVGRGADVQSHSTLAPKGADRLVPPANPPLDRPVRELAFSHKPAVEAADARGVVPSDAPARKAPPVGSAKPEVFARQRGFVANGAPIQVEVAAISPSHEEPTNRSPMWDPDPEPSGRRAREPDPNESRAGTRPLLGIEEARFARKVRDAANLGRLRLDVAPANVCVYIDAARIADGAPIEIQTSAKVEHVLELKADGFSDFATTFVLTPGEVRDFQIVLAERR